MTPDGKVVVLSGIRATGRMHLGNYLGVLERFAALSRDPTRQCFFFIADLHTLTTHKDASRIRKEAPEIVMDMLAAGVDPARAVIYIQSRVPVVAELTWYLACLAPASEVEKLPTYKDKAAKHPDDVNVGLFAYPVLMAADILGPRADFVPVGVDQKPHLELTRELARKFNTRYGRYFPVPDDLGEEMLSVPGLVAQDSAGHFGKMGKSEAPGQTLYLSDTPEVMTRKIRRAPTDPARIRREDPGTPSKCVIFALHGLVSSDVVVQWSADGCRTAGISCVECKDALAGSVVACLADFQERRLELAAHPERIEEIVEEGSKKARVVFEETTAYVADCMGVFRPRG